MTDKVLYSELTPAEFRERLAAVPVAYLPLGTLEWHGEHLPLGSDGIQSQGFFEMLAARVGGIHRVPIRSSLETWPAGGHADVKQG